MLKKLLCLNLKELKTIFNCTFWAKLSPVVTKCNPDEKLQDFIKSLTKSFIWLHKWTEQHQAPDAQLIKQVYREIRL